MKRRAADRAKEVRRASRAILGEPSRGRRRGPHKAERQPASKLWTAEEVCLTWRAAPIRKLDARPAIIECRVADRRRHGLRSLGAMESRVMYMLLLPSLMFLENPGTAATDMLGTKMLGSDTVSRGRRQVNAGGPRMFTGRPAIEGSIGGTPGSRAELVGPQADGMEALRKHLRSPA